MGIEEIVGFLIVLFIFFFPLLKKLLLKKKALPSSPREEQELQEEELIEPVPVKIAEPDFELHSTIEDRKLQTRLTARDKKNFKKKQDPIAALVKSKDPLQSMVVLSEVFGPPKSMQ